MFILGTCMRNTTSSGKSSLHTTPTQIQKSKIFVSPWEKWSRKFRSLRLFHFCFIRHTEFYVCCNNGRTRLACHHRTVPHTDTSTMLQHFKAITLRLRRAETLIDTSFPRIHFSRSGILDVHIVGREEHCHSAIVAVSPHTCADAAAASRFTATGT